MMANYQRLLFAGSAILNLAFATVWLGHVVPEVLGGWQSFPEGSSAICCPLHKQLGVTEDQWRQIEPRLKEFRRSARAQCGRLSRLRGELLDLLASDCHDCEAIVAKQEEIVQAQRETQKLVIDHLIIEKEVLTTDQETTLFAMIRRQIASDGECAVTSSPSRGGFGRVFREEAR